MTQLNEHKSCSSCKHFKEGKFFTHYVKRCNATDTIISSTDAACGQYKPIKSK